MAMMIVGDLPGGSSRKKAVPMPMLIVGDPMLVVGDLSGGKSRKKAVAMAMLGDLGVAVTVMMIVGDLRKKAMATLMTMFFGDPGWSSWKKAARSMQLGGQ